MTERHDGHSRAVQPARQGTIPMIGPTLDETLKACNGYYRTPKYPCGKRRRGPLVGYAGKYDVGDGTQAHWVGEVFFNCAKLEQWPFMLDHYAEHTGMQLAEIDGYYHSAVYLGAPMGGITFAQALARADGYARAIYAEKKVIEAETENQREQSILVLDRHELKPDDHVIITEDVVNNLSTTSKVIKLILDAGAIPIAIACLKNRSKLTVYEESGLSLPIIAYDHAPTEQYRQDDPYVREDIEAGRIIWKPKNHWDEIELYIE